MEGVVLSPAALGPLTLQLLGTQEEDAKKGMPCCTIARLGSLNTISRALLESAIALGFQVFMFIFFIWGEQAPLKKGEHIHL